MYSTYLYTYTATSKLLNIVKSEISAEKNILENLPTFSLFNISLDGSVATLSRSYQNEEVKVQLDVGRANESDEMEVESDSGGDLEETGKELYDEEEVDEKEVCSYD